MTETELRELIARELWFQFTKSNYSWDNLISTYKNPWYKRADIFIDNTKLKQHFGIK